MDLRDISREFATSEHSTVYLVSRLSLFAEHVRSAARRLGCESRCYESFGSFLSEYSASIPGCVFLSVGQIDATAIYFLSQIKAINKQAQVLVSPYSWKTHDIVLAIHSGFVDFLDKMSDIDRLDTALASAIDRDLAIRCKSGVELPESILACLDREEAEIFRCIVLGCTTKEIGGELEISVRTVHYRKKSIFQKLGLRNRDDAFELIRNLRRDRTAPPPHFALKSSPTKIN